MEMGIFSFASRLSGCGSWGSQRGCNFWQLARIDHGGDAGKGTTAVVAACRKTQLYSWTQLRSVRGCTEEELVSARRSAQDE
jgi:hypothetical protein